MGESEGAAWALRAAEEGYRLEPFLGGVALRTVCASRALRLLPCGRRAWTFWIVVVGLGSYRHTAWQWLGCWHRKQRPSCSRRLRRAAGRVALAIHDGAVDHHGDRGRGSGIARSGDKVRCAGWHSGTGRGIGTRGRGARGAGIRQGRKVRIFTKILVVIAGDLGGVFSSLLPSSKGLGSRGE